MNKHLIDYTLHLADNALILGHRNSEWCGHGPVLEQDIAITNISLDLIGQARNFYQYAATLMNSQQVSPTGGDLSARLSEEGAGGEVSEDSLAYFRNSSNFKSSESTLAAVLGTRSCNSKSAALSNGQAMKRRCIGRSRNKLTNASRLIP